jgi:hypothetical protein
VSFPVIFFCTALAVSRSISLFLCPVELVIKSGSYGFFETCIVATLEAILRGPTHLISRNSRPIERVSIPAGQLADKLSLRAAVPIPKGVNGIKLAHVIGGAVCEFRTAKVGQVTFLIEIAREFTEALRNMIAEGEWKLPGPGYINGAKLAGTWIHVLKNVTVDRLKMAAVEISSDRISQQLANASRGHIHFKLG